MAGGGTTADGGGNGAPGGENTAGRAGKEGAARKKPTPLIRDIRLFLNTVEHAVDTMRRSGVAATMQKEETEEYIEYVVRIPKQAQEKTARPLTIHTA